jgi:hypothetical protein
MVLDDSNKLRQDLDYSERRNFLQIASISIVNNKLKKSAA